VEESEGTARVVDFEKDRSLESEEITNSACIPELRADLWLPPTPKSPAGRSHQSCSVFRTKS